MLEAVDLRKEYRTGRRSVVAVDGVSLKVGTGELVALTGRSGSGKSTLLAMLCGLCRPSGGRVIVDGLDLASLAPDALADFRAERVGFVLQVPSLLPTLRVVDNVALPALLARRRDLAAAYARAETLLGEVGLGDRLEAHPDDLSGGEQRRVALARALVNDPPLVLADEPTGDLDEETERDIVERLVHLHRARGATLVLVTHSPALARRADRVLRLSAGRVEDADERASVPTRSPRAIPASDPSATAAPALGAGLRRFVLGFAVWTAIVVAGILALDLAVAAVQQRGATRQQAARDELRRAAFQRLRADVESVAPDGAAGYRVTLAMDNLDPERALFVLGPAVRVFIQVSGGWKEVPSHLADGVAAAVTRVTGRRVFTLTFSPEVTTFEEQLAGYYHVRISNVMLVSRSREARDDVLERADAYYVYVKPRGADDAELRRRNGWSGTPPAWIPMPAH